MKKTSPPETSAVEDRQARALHGCIALLMRRFRLEPGLLAGSVYAGLHANDVGLFEVLAAPGEWNVHRISETLHAPDSTISSALDRLEKRGLVERRRIPADRRVVRIGLTTEGLKLAERLSEAHIENCRVMLASLAAEDREDFLRMVEQVAGS
jgi:DNA-binding MarR family transcriptional regulator